MNSRINQLNRTGFVIWTPDATTTGIYRDGIQYLYEQGLEFVAFSWVYISSRQVRELYLLDQYSIDKYIEKLLETFFGLDYSLACLVQAPPHFHSLPLAHYLTSIKGPANPILRKPTHLRTILGSGNQLLNFVHMSDTPEAVIREATLFLPAIFDNPLPWTTNICPSLPGGVKQQESVNVFFVLHGVKNKLYQRYCQNHNPLFLQALDKEKQLAKKKVKTSEDLGFFRELYKNQQKLLSGYTLTKIEAHNMLMLLLSEDMLQHDIDGILRALSSLEIVITPWEDLILRSQWTLGSLR